MKTPAPVRPENRSVSLKARRHPAPVRAGFNRRWLQYAMAAGAGLAMAGQPAEAEIVYTPPRSYTLTPFSFLPIDFNHRGGAEFSVRCNYSSLFGFGSLNLYQAGRFVSAGTASVVGTFAGAQLEAAALPPGARIGPEANFQNIDRRFAQMAFNHSVRVGQWQNVQHRFLGLRFTINRNTYYGWAEFSVKLGKPGHHLWVIARPEGYAYESTPNTPIFAGQKADGSSRLEPATLGRLALGAPGLALWRKEQPDVSPAVTG